MAETTTTTTGSPELLVAERSSPRQISPVVVKPVNRKRKHSINAHPFVQRAKAIQVLKKYQKAEFNKAQLRAAKAKNKSKNAKPIKRAPKITPTKRSAATSSDEDVVSLETETDDLRDILTRGKLLKRSTLKPINEQKSHGQAVPDPIPPNSHSNIRTIVRVVSKTKKQVGVVRNTQTQTFIGTRSFQNQAGPSYFSIEKRSVATQADETDLQSAYECVQHMKLTKIEPSAPTHLDHSFDFGTHQVPVHRAPNRPAQRQFQRQFRPQFTAQAQYQPQFAPPAQYQLANQPQNQQFIQHPVYHPNPSVPPSFQNPVQYQFQPVQYAPIQYLPLQL